MSHGTSVHAGPRWLAIVVVLVAGAGVGASPAGATPPSVAHVVGTDTASEQREWFNTPFGFDAGPLGRVRGRVRFVTETTAGLSSTRALTSADRGELDAGDTFTTEVHNEVVSSRVRVTARPALQVLFEWQPDGDAYVCDDTTFPTFTEDDWSMRTDGGGEVRDGVCGAIEVTADDLNTIPVDLELPEVFALLDEPFDPGYGGTRTLGHSSQVLEIKVCKIATVVFDAPIGDRCDLQLNAETTVPVTTLAQALHAQLCTSGELDGQPVSCLSPFGPLRALTYDGPIESFQSTAPCPDAATEVDVRAVSPVWDARVDAVDIGLSLDLNIHLRRDGEGRDVVTLPLPGTIHLLSAPLGLRVEHSSAVLHVGDLGPDDDPPEVLLDPSDVTVDEGSTATLTPSVSDRCTPAEQLVSRWTIDGSTSGTPSLTRTYLDDNPTALHAGALTVADARGNQSAPHPFSIRVRNVAPAVTLAAPAEPFAVGTLARFRADVTDPGADRMTWAWDFGDGTTAGRTASDALDRTDERTHAFVQPGEHVVRVGVDDATDARSADATVVVFDPLDRLAGTGTFTADASSSHVPQGSSLRLSANVGYPRGAVRPAGDLRSSFVRVGAAGGPQPATFEATSFEWLFEHANASRVRGVGALDGEPGWTFAVETARDARNPRTARLTMSLWRPGSTTDAPPDHRFSGLRDTGNVG